MNLKLLRLIVCFCNKHVWTIILSVNYKLHFQDACAMHFCVVKPISVFPTLRSEICLSIKNGFYMFTLMRQILFQSSPPWLWMIKKNYVYVNWLELITCDENWLDFLYLNGKKVPRTNQLKVIKVCFNLLQFSSLGLHYGVVI